MSCFKSVDSVFSPEPTSLGLSGTERHGMSPLGGTSETVQHTHLPDRGGERKTEEWATWPVSTRPRRRGSSLIRRVWRTSGKWGGGPQLCQCPYRGGGVTAQSGEALGGWVTVRPAPLAVLRKHGESIRLATGCWIKGLNQLYVSIKGQGSLSYTASQADPRSKTDQLAPGWDSICWHKGSRTKNAGLGRGLGAVGQRDSKVFCLKHE